MVEAFSVMLPLSRWARPQASSTISWPRVISPSASESTLPCSLVMISAASCLRSLSSSRNRNSTWVRRARDMSRHLGNAAAAEAITASASARDARATCLVTAPGGRVVHRRGAVGLTRERRPVLPVRQHSAVAGGALRRADRNRLGIGDRRHRIVELL